MGLKREKEMTLYTLQKPPKWEVFEEAMVDMYNRMFHKYFKEIKLISLDNTIEIQYETYIKEPCTQLKRIYNELNLPGIKKIKKSLKTISNSKRKSKHIHTT